MITKYDEKLPFCVLGQQYLTNEMGSLQAHLKAKRTFLFLSLTLVPILHT